MSGNIAVVYEKGVLRPLHPLNLPEQTELEIRIVRKTGDEIMEAEKAYRALLQSGLIQPAQTVDIDPIPESELRRVADAFGQAGALSEVIIAERDEV